MKFEFRENFRMSWLKLRGKLSFDHFSCPLDGFSGGIVALFWLWIFYFYHFCFLFNFITLRFLIFFLLIFNGIEQYFILIIIFISFLHGFINYSGINLYNISNFFEIETIKVFKTYIFILVLPKESEGKRNKQN